MNAINNLRFLELSVGCDDVLHALGFYQQLGFSTIQTNDIWDYPYVVMSDGRCNLGLHLEQNFNHISQAPRFTFAHNDVAFAQRALLDQNLELAYSDLDNDNHIQNCLFTSPSGFGTHILAARPFSPLSEQTDSQLGYFRAYLIPLHMQENAKVYWETLGLLVMEDKTQGVHVSTQGFHAIVGDFPHLKQPALLFEHPDPESIFPYLARFGISVSIPETRELAMRGAFSIRSPEGLEFIVRKVAS